MWGLLATFILALCLIALEKWVDVVYPTETLETRFPNRRQRMIMLRIILCLTFGATAINYVRPWDKPMSNCSENAEQSPKCTSTITANLPIVPPAILTYIETTPQPSPNIISPVIVELTPTSPTQTITSVVSITVPPVVVPSSTPPPIPIQTPTTPMMAEVTLPAVTPEPIVTTIPLLPTDTPTLTATPTLTLTPTPGITAKPIMPTPTFTITPTPETPTVTATPSPTATPTSTVTPPPSFCPPTFRFEFDGSGNPLLPGQIIDAEWSNWGVTVSVGGRQQVAMIFDSAAPTGGDLDLGTPHEDFGGPGVGAGGGVGQPGSNELAHRQILIISENGDPSDPNDAENGGLLIFTFAQPVSIHSLGLLDMEYANANAPAVIRVYATNGTLVGAWPAVRLGDNSFQQVFVNTLAVARLEVQFHGSGALTDVVFCEDRATD